METEEGAPQGGNLSPLLSNIMLNELDKELMKRGLKFCRYADDCNIYVRSRTTSALLIWAVLLEHWMDGFDVGYACAIGNNGRR